MKLRKTLAGILGAVVMLLGVGTFEHINRETGVHAAEEWVLVKNASDLAAGDKIVIAAKDYNYALSTTQNSNNRGQASITKNDDKILFGETVQIIDVEEGTVAGTLSFKTNAGYLYCASTSSKNYLRSQNSINAAASWTVTINPSTGVATVKSNISGISRNLLSYNNSSSIFACYSSVQKDILIYEKITTAEAECAHDYVIPEEGKEYVVEEMTCSKPATYAKVCSKCGVASLDDYYMGTETAEHKFNNSTGICSVCDSLRDGVLTTLRYYLNEYYNDNQYLKDTTIYTNSAADEDAAKYFHAAACVKNRETWYFGDKDNGTTKLVMNTHEDLEDDEINGEVDVTSTYENDNDRVWHTGKGGDWHVNWTSVEDKFVTLKDFIDSSDENWTYSNGTFTYNLEKTTYNEDTNVVTEHVMTRMARSFVAPMWQDPNSQNFNYARFSKLTIKEDNNQLVMKLFVEDDNFGILVENKQSERLFAQATINKVYNLSVITDENCSFVEDIQYVASNHSYTCNVVVNEGFDLEAPTCSTATVSMVGLNSINISKVNGDVVISLNTKVATNQKEVTMKYTGGVTGNFTENINVADKLNLDDSIFTVITKKDSANQNVGYNKDNDFRIYAKSGIDHGLTISIADDYIIDSIVITFTSNSYSNARVVVDGKVVTGTNGTYEINNNSLFIGHNIYSGNSKANQVRISSIVITYHSI